MPSLFDSLNGLPKTPNFTSNQSDLMGHIYNVFQDGDELVDVLLQLKHDKLVTNPQHFPLSHQKTAELRSIDNRNDLLHALQHMLQHQKEEEDRRIAQWLQMCERNAADLYDTMSRLEAQSERMDDSPLPWDFSSKKELVAELFEYINQIKKH